MKSPVLFVQTNFQYLIVDTDDIDYIEQVEHMDNTFKIAMKNGNKYTVSITDLELFCRLGVNNQ